MREQRSGGHQDDHPVYRFWHGHISTLIAAQRPDVDAEMIAHVLLGALHSEPILACLAADGPARPAAAVRALARAILDAPELGRRARTPADVSPCGGNTAPSE